MILMRYTIDGVTKEYTFTDDRLDEILRRCAEKFGSPLSAQDVERFEDIMRRYPPPKGKR